MKKKIAVLLTLAMVFMLLAGCGSSNNTGNAGNSTSEPTSAPVESDTAGDGHFPITIHHAFGETIIESKPERIVIIAWENGDTPLALGIAPVGISESNYGAETEHHLHSTPWNICSMTGGTARRY